MELTKEEMELIKNARSLLASLKLNQDGSKKNAASSATKTAYEKEFNRLLKVGNGKRTEIISAARDTKSASTWYRRKAAIVMTMEQNIETALKNQDYFQREMRSRPTAENRARFIEQLKLLNNSCVFLNSVKEVGPIPEENRKKRATKRTSLKGLPDNWRENIANRMIKYKAPFLVAALTGCRPQELVHGVKLEIVDGLIKATIKGAKVTENAGQKQRVISLKIDGKLANDLAELVRDGKNVVTLGSASNFTTAIRDAGRREYKNNNVDLSAYSLRHQFASDMKAAGFPAEDIAKAMGHISDKTASYYGSRQQNRGGGPKVESVTASKKVKQKARPFSGITTKLKIKPK